MLSLVFPGQGSQYIGMGKEFYESLPEVKTIFDQAEEITQIPVKRLCFEGPMEELTLTQNLQVCLTVVDLACFKAVELTKKVSPEAVAGHSLGEYPALFAAGVLSLEDTLLAVKKRGEVMQKAGGTRPSGMYAVIGCKEELLEKFVNEANGLVVIANYNSPKQLVISGESPAVDEVAKLAKQSGARVVKLKVSAAFHSPLMQEAQEEFANFLESLTWKDPKVKFVSNVTGNFVSSAEEIKELMKVQITSSVKWIDCVNHMFESGINTFVEVGPKRVLTGLVSQILEGKDFTCLNVEKPEDVEKLLSYLPNN